MSNSSEPRVDVVCATSVHPLSADSRVHAVGTESPHQVVIDFLYAIRAKGVRIWIEGEQLRFRAPAGVLKPDQLRELRSRKSAIISYLQEIEVGAVAQLKRRSNTDLIPLTYSQLVYWRWHRMCKREHLRQIASVVQLTGQLDIIALKESLERVIARHEALRTVIVVREGVPQQEVLTACDSQLRFVDLACLPEDRRDEELGRRIDEDLLERVDISQGPLLKVNLFKIRIEEHILLVAMEHLISDGTSSNIFLRDLLSFYREIVYRIPSSLPEIRVQFADYAVCQHQSDSAWHLSREPYWSQRLSGCVRSRFPDDGLMLREGALGWGTIKFTISNETRYDLQRWCREQRITLVMGVLTAYAALLLRWCNVRTTVIRYQTDGRVLPEMQNVIGYFAAVLYLRVDLAEDDTLASLADRLLREFCAAIEHADEGRIEARDDLLELARNPAFNWLHVPRKPLPQEAVEEDTIRWSVLPVEHPMAEQLVKDAEPLVLFLDTDEEILGQVYFPRDRFREEKMQRFSACLLKFIGELIRGPDRRVCTLELV